MNELVYATGSSTGELRTLKNGKLAVRIVALVGGRVLHAVNSDAPELVPPATLYSNVTAWPGLPVTYNHPNVNGRQLSATTPGVLASFGIGTITAAHVSDNALRMDVLIDPIAAEQLGAGPVLARLKNGEAVDVSVGAFVQVDDTPGTQGGRRYARRWTSLRPDHVAFVTRGACSAVDGCFARAACADTAESYAPIDPYAAPLAKLRAARRPEETFADRYRAARLAELQAEYAAQERRS